MIDATGTIVIKVAGTTPPPEPFPWAIIAVFGGVAVVGFLLLKK